MIRLSVCRHSRLLAVLRPFGYYRLAHSSGRAPHIITELSKMSGPPQPDLPHPAHLDLDSALGRKFGKEVTNYFGGESNRRASCDRSEQEKGN